MLNFFSKLVGVNSPPGPEMVEMACVTDWDCVYDNRQATNKYVNGKTYFVACGC
jgi:hypothetical protein